jgi:hypothetical protein
MTVKLRKQLTKTTGKLRLTGFPSKNHLATVGGSESGATVAVTLVVVLAVIAGTAVVAQRSFDGLVGSVFQGRAKDARLTAEAGTAFIISEWNRPANRRLYTGLPMGSWSTAKNRCTAPSPDFNIANAPNPTAAATSFANGNEVTLPGGGADFSRRFVLISATFTPGTAAGRGNPFTVTGNPVASAGDFPAISETNTRGFLEIVVEGRVYRAGSQTPDATSRITREFIVEPKCCTRSFGGVIINAPDLGNDFRECPGESDLPIGDLAIVTGIGGGGGLTASSGNSSLKITDATPSKLNSLTCTRPPESTAGTCDFRTNDLQTELGPIDYEIKPITLPNPPSIADARTTFCAAQPGGPSPCTILNGTGLNINSATTIDSNDAGTSNCHRGSHPPGSAEAYHCIVSSISLSGAGSALTVDTTSRPVYFYLQQNAQNINVGGNGVINHQNNGSNAPLSLTNRFQIRGITKPSGSACTSSQDFDLRGNASTAMFIWGPCANTSMRGTTDFGGIIWTNTLNFSGGGTGTISLAIPSNPGTCVPGSSAVPCSVLEDIGELDPNSKPIDWAARSINFTRFF